jgi:hypothetical protein
MEVLQSDPNFIGPICPPQYLSAVEKAAFVKALLRNWEGFEHATSVKSLHHKLYHLDHLI